MPDSAFDAARQSSPSSAAVVSVGTFDGVHIGHRALIGRASHLARRLGGDISVIALVFDPSPAEILRPGAVPPRLTTWEQKEELLLAAGAAQVHRLRPTPELLSRTAEDFIGGVVDRLNARGFVEGLDFRFGRGRSGDVRTLAALGRSAGFSVEVVDPVTVVLNDHTIAPARSSLVRWLIEHGRIADAARILGRPHTLRGRVVQGDRRGRTIGYPTINVESPCLAPADGVYAGRARLPDGRVLNAAISVGTKPTFGVHERAVEAFLFESGRGTPSGSQPSDWAPIPGLSEYGWTVDLEIVAWVRDQVRFQGLEPLLEQMSRDCARIDSVLRSDVCASRLRPTLAETETAG